MKKSRLLNKSSRALKNRSYRFLGSRLYKINSDTFDNMTTFCFGDPVDRSKRIKRMKMKRAMNMCFRVKTFLSVEGDREPFRLPLNRGRSVFFLRKKSSLMLFSRYDYHRFIINSSSTGSGLKCCLAELVPFIGYLNLNQRSAGSRRPISKTNLDFNTTFKACCPVSQPLLTYPRDCCS
jgi:hypothetical protein